MSFLLYFKDLFTALILRPLLRDPFRTTITILGVAVGVAVFLSIRLANQQTMMSFTESVDLVLGRADAVIRVEGIAFDEVVFEKLHTLRDEIKAYPVIEGYGVESTSGEVVEIIGTDLLQDNGIRDFSIKTIEKDLKGLIPLIMDPAGVILPEKFVPGTHFGPGDTIEFLIKGQVKTLNVNAILEDKGIAKALNGNFALMDIAAAQNAFEKLLSNYSIDERYGSERYIIMTVIGLVLATILIICEAMVIRFTRPHIMNIIKKVSNWLR